MSADRDDFRAGYAAAFGGYLVSAGETGLESAYELGRKAVAEGLSLLDLAGIHHAVLGDRLRAAQTPDEMARIATAGADFFLESLAIFEMTQRGFLEVQETAQLQQRHAGRLRGLADAALAINSSLSVDEMLELVAERAREIVGAEQSEVSLGGDDDPASPHDGWLAADLIDREGRRLGLIQLAGKREGEFDADDEVMLVQLAQMASVAIENARLYEHERDIAVTLQRNLLPARLPQVPGLGSAARYLAGGDGVEVGGDWYELIPLSGDKVGVAIGDVVGRGVRAASIMGQLRPALRAYALELERPAEVARRLARFVKTLDADQMTTCVYALLEPGIGALHFTNAGHPPPLLLGPNGEATFLEGERSVPLGVMADPPYTENVAKLSPGCTLLLYTDGLVERRDEPITRGLERLRAAAAEAPRAPEPLCDHIVELLVERTPSDDVALLAVHAAVDAASPLRLTLPAVPDSLALVRRRLRAWLERTDATELEAYDVVLSVCEAAANAVEHAYGPVDAAFELAAHLDEGEVVVTVRDFGAWRPPRQPSRGRGLIVMRAAMDTVEVQPDEEGTTVVLRRRLGATPDRHA
jgi:serine phosphatase RsbU (regulator of sigma subunit)/anti-sigma regulatory factor (Ser/Thr protein kinase)